MNEAQNYALIKAAALGYAQSLYNNGATDEEVHALVSHYTDDTNGTLVKKAARQQYIMGLVAQRLQQIGAL